MIQYTSSSLLLLLLASLLLIGHTELRAQPDRILPNPNAVQLQRIWSIDGEPSQELGHNVASLGDITGDGLGDFAVRDVVGMTGWDLFEGRAPTPASLPIWRCDSAILLYSARPTGDGSQWLLVWNMTHPGAWSNGAFITRPVYELRLHRMVDGRPETNATYREPLIHPDTIRTISVQVVDLDQDGADEIVVLGSMKEGTNRILIYQGGTALRLDTPTLVLPTGSDYGRIDDLRITDVDGDTYPDLLVSFHDSPGRVFWGGSTLPDLSATGSRIIDSLPVPLDDVDGDGIIDLGRYRNNDKMVMFLSGRGKNARTRQFDNSDTDFELRTPTREFTGGGRLRGDEFGSLVIWDYKREKDANGSFYRVDDSLLFFMGRPNGPDHSFDAIHVVEHTEMTSNITPIRAKAIADCNGDGWNDYLIGHPQFKSGRGTAYILAGGPYIPREDPSLGVHDLTLEGKPNALSLWPMPARDELNIAWRGDLARTPRRFIVTDLRGGTVATGSVEAGVGAARWDCADVASGIYQLVMLDERGERIASEMVIKR